MSVASIFNFKVDLIELILVLDLNPALAIVSGCRESASALAKLGFETVIAILSEAEILGSGVFCRRGLYGFCLRPVTTSMYRRLTRVPYLAPNPPPRPVFLAIRSLPLRGSSLYSPLHVQRLCGRFSSIPRL